ncbi:MAG TPA: S8 family serine peptidase [Anaerolineales bacterium]|nr:S8 family serine peptidase [Anaerolineales bacterium]
MNDLLDQLSERKNLVIGLVVGGIVLLILAGAGLWWLNNKNQTSPDGGNEPMPTLNPDITLEAPPALESLIEQYPQLKDILSDPGISSAYKDFLVAYEEGGLSAAEALATERGLLNDDKQLELLIIVDDPANVPSTIESLKRLQIQISTYADNQINVLVPWSLLEVLSQEQGRIDQVFAQLGKLEHVVEVKLPINTRRQSPLAASNIEGEGVHVSGADLWHQQGFLGAGVKIAVLDMGFSGYQALLGEELPENVTTAAFGADSIDADSENHGTACAEIVHEMAPEAELYLVYFDGSFTALSQAIDYLKTQDIDIVSYSAGTSYGPKDGTGPDAQLVDEMASLGVLWVSAAGNEADTHYRDQFRDEDGDGLHEFPDGSEAMLVRSYSDYQEILLQWDDWGNTDQDFDLHFYNENGELLTSSTDFQSGGAYDEPVEYIEWYDNVQKGDVFYVQIERSAASRPIVIDLYTHVGEIPFFNAEHSLSSPADAQGAFAVGAVEWRDDSLAYYSSQGPTDDGRIKPDISAPTTVSGDTYGEEGFDGTSAATPHVAGAAALVWSRFPEMERTDVMLYLEENALDLGDAGPDPAFGFGRLSLPADAPPPTDLPTAVPDQPTSLPAPTNTAIILPTSVPDWESNPPPSASVTSDENSLGWLIACFSGILCCGGSLLFFGLLLLLVWPRRKKNQPVSVIPAQKIGTPVTPAPVSPAQPLVSKPIGTQPAQAQLVGPGGEIFNLQHGSGIGRAPYNQIVLNNALVSREHARIEYRDGQWYLIDLRSANGTRINRTRVEVHPLRQGDVIEIEGILLRFEIDMRHE